MYDSFTQSYPSKCSEVVLYEEYFTIVSETQAVPTVFWLDASVSFPSPACRAPAILLVSVEGWSLPLPRPFMKDLVEIPWIPKYEWMIHMKLRMPPSAIAIISNETVTILLNQEWFSLKNDP